MSIGTWKKWWPIRGYATTKAECQNAIRLWKNGGGDETRSVRFRIKKNSKGAYAEILTYGPKSRGEYPIYRP